MSGNRFDYTSPYLGSKAQQNAKASDEDNYEGLHIVESEYATKDDYIADREFVVRPTTTHTAEIAYERCFVMEVAAFDATPSMSVWRMMYVRGI